MREQGLDVDVVHQAGSRWTEVVRTAYADLEIEATVEAFLDKPWEAIADVDLVVSRAGALTVSELAASGRGALLDSFCGGGGQSPGVQRAFARARRRRGGPR